jgi:GntR family transcriptional regulator
MHISLSKNSDIPLRQQLAEQIVFLITTGQLQIGQELPSVRALARLVKVHHNTVSEAYQDLVRRKWLTRRQGSRLVVGINLVENQHDRLSLDEVINESIQRAKEMGYSLQALRKRVRERLLAQPPDHVLVVEDELGLREIIRKEVHEKIRWPVEACSLQTIIQEPGLTIGAQVLAPNHIISELKPFVPESRPVVSISYSQINEHVDQISRLKDPSVIAVASVSESLLKTARSLLAAAIAQKHTFQEFQISGTDRISLKGADLVFCDSFAMSVVQARRKIHYQLIDSDCLEHLRAALELESLET